MREPAAYCGLLLFHLASVESFRISRAGSSIRSSVFSTGEMHATSIEDIGTAAELAIFHLW